MNRTNAQVARHDFYAVDMALYLNTHPDDTRHWLVQRYRKRANTLRQSLNSNLGRFILPILQRCSMAMD